MADLKNKLSQQIRSQKRTFSPPGKSGDPFGICGRRVLAFIIDIAALVAIGRIIVYMAGDRLSFLGENGWWVGLGVAALYFGFLDSAIGGGRTLGKRLTHIEVQNISGKELSVIDSILRFVPFGLIFAIEFATRYTDPTSFIIHGLRMFEILIILGISVFGLLHPQHRALQDILLDSVVTRSPCEFQLPEASLRKPLSALLMAYLLFGGLYLIWTSNALASQDGQIASRMWRIVNARENSEHPFVFIGTTPTPSGLQMKTVFVHVFLSDQKKMNDPKYLAASAKVINAELMQKTPMPNDVDRVTIYIRSGCDIGIWRDYKNADFSFLISEFGHEAPTVYRRTTRGKSQVKNKPKKL
jgi:uncharacterized RDD family membrane protein YckC